MADAPSLSLNDLWRAWLVASLPAAVVAGTDEVVPGSGGSVTQPVSVAQYLSSPWLVKPPANESVSASGTVTAPGAGAAIATIVSGSLPAGTYLVEAEAVYTATAPAAAEDLNIEIREAAVSKRKLAMPRANNVVGTGRCQLVLDGSTAISINAVGAATAAVVYTGAITATKLD
jgi:hypothetical protein